MIAVVDSGTTRTRLRLWDGQQVVWNHSRAVGARDTAADGNNHKLKAALAHLLTEAQAIGTPQAVVCSGMITSNLGLLEVPHLLAPCSPQDTARGIVHHDFPEIAAIPFYFIPGIKTQPQALTLATLEQADLLRGEETEALGLRELLQLSGPTLLLHYGSHHKALWLDAQGYVVGSQTSITGELLVALMGHTVLKGSVEPLETLEPDLEFFQAGLEAARQHGLGRAAFLVRVGEHLAGYSKTQMTSYLLGVLSSLDLSLLLPAQTQQAAIVLYGSGHFPAVMKAWLVQQGIAARLIDPQTAELSAVVGAVRLLERYIAVL